MTTTRNTHAADQIIVTDEVIAASEDTVDVIVVAIYSGGDQAPIPDDEYRSIRGGNLDQPGGNPEVVAAAFGWVDDTGQWVESERLVRSYWTDGDLSYYSALDAA